MTQQSVPSPSMQSAAALVAAERFGMPVVGERASQLIAALHSLINWLIEHPDVPVATRVELIHHPDHGNTTVTVEDLVVLANTLDATVNANRGTHWVTKRVCTTAEHGANVDVTVFSGDVRARVAAL